MTKTFPSGKIMVGAIISSSSQISKERCNLLNSAVKDLKDSEDLIEGKFWSKLPTVKSLRSNGLEKARLWYNEKDKKAHSEVNLQWENTLYGAMLEVKAVDDFIDITYEDGFNSVSARIPLGWKFEVDWEARDLVFEKVQMLITESLVCLQYLRRINGNEK